MDLGGERPGAQAFPAAIECLVHDAPSEPTASQDQLTGHAMNHDIALIDAEIEQRFGAIVIAHEHRRELCACCELQAGMHPIIAGPHGFDRRGSAIPIVVVALALRSTRGERRLNLV